MKVALVLLACFAAIALAVPNTLPYFEGDFKLSTSVMPLVPLTGHFWFDYEEQKQRIDILSADASRTKIDDFTEKLSYMVVTRAGAKPACTTCFLDQSIYQMTVPSFCNKTGEETVNGQPTEVWKGFYQMTDMSFWVTKTATPYIVRSYFNVLGSIAIQWDFSNVLANKPDSGVWMPNATCSQPVCKAPLDLIILADGSGSIAPNDWLLMKNFASRIVNQFDVSETTVKIGWLEFSDRCYISSPLGGNKPKLLQDISNTRQVGSNTNMDDGLRTSLSVLLKNGRAGVPKVVVMFTDGAPNAGNNPVAVSKTLKDQGIIMYTVGVGKGADPNLLKQIASEPAETHFLYADSFTKLQSLLNTLIQATCKGDICTAVN